MKSKYKRILLFWVTLLICVASILITGCTSNKKTDNSESETAYQNMLKESQTALSTLEGENAELKKVNEELEKENKDLQTKLTQASSEKSDITTQDQVMTDLMEIYNLYKSGKSSEALEKIKKIEPMGFDDATLAFYEILKDVLEK